VVPFYDEHASEADARLREPLADIPPPALPVICRPDKPMNGRDEFAWSHRFHQHLVPVRRIRR